jgi:hypothetical protein
MTYPTTVLLPLTYFHSSSFITDPRFNGFETQKLKKIERRKDTTEPRRIPFPFPLSTKKKELANQQNNISGSLEIKNELGKY